MKNRFDIYEIPDGHLARFESKLDRHYPGLRVRCIVFRTASIAAMLALVFFAGMGRGSHFRHSHTPESVYNAYLEQVGDLYRLLADNTGKDDSIDWESVLHELTDETVPLYDQLPDELSERKKTAILKDYYGGILDKARKLNETNNKK